MRKHLLLSCIILCQIAQLHAQSLNTAVKNAFLVTRMAEKFHFSPRPLDDEFSSNIFNQLLKQLDDDRLFFTAGDIKTLSAYKYQIDEEVKSQQSTFLLAITKIYLSRISKADTMIDHICQLPFNFSVPDKLTVAEDTSYPADEKAMRLKLSKLLKLTALDDILQNDRITSFDPASLKKYTDSIEPIARKRSLRSLKHFISIMKQGAGGIEQAVGNEYCKAIAVCYDPHTAFFPLTEKEDFDSELGQQQMVFGFSIKEDDDGSVKITNIAPGSPAFKSGQINKGDKIETVQWEDKQPIDVSSGGERQLSEVLSMSNHDKATLKIKKQDGSERSVVLSKEQMAEDGEENKVKSFLLKGTKTVGFISLPAFYQDWEDEREGVNGCANDVAKEILKLKKENIEGLIIDLRYNGGGSMKEAIELSGIFIDAGPVGLDKSRDSKVFTLKDVNRGTIYDGPLMLMVNGYSASASEMVAGTLQDYHRAVIVGSPTYGKATAQIVLPMDTTLDLDKDVSNVKADSYLKVTVSQLYRVNGTTAQATGVQPDVILPDLLQAHPKREADNLYVLHPTPIEGNKYFRPYPAVNYDNLRSLAKSNTEASTYFRQLNQYILYEQSNAQKKDLSLRLNDAVQSMKKEAAAHPDKEIEKTGTAPYSVQNNSFESKQLQVNDDLKEMNNQWTKFLTSDPYLQIAYNLMLLMIK